MKLRKIHILVLLVLMTAPGAVIAKESAGSLFSLLLSRDVKDQKFALDYLKKDRPQDLPDKIVSFLEHRTYREQKSLFEALKFYPQKKLLSPCLRILGESDSYILKRDVIGFLSDFRERDVVMPIARELVSPHQPIRQAAAMALKKNGDDRMYPIIIGMSDHSNPVHRIYFIEAMFYLYDRRFYPHLVEMLRDDNKSIRIYVLNCFRKNGLTEANSLIRNCALADKNDEVKIAAVETIGEFRDGSSLFVLLRTIDDKNRDLRLATVRAMNQIASSGAANSLALRLNVEEDKEIKDQILDALMTLKKAGDLRGLEKVLLNDKDPLYRVKAAYILGAIKDQRAASVIFKGFEDADERVRAELSDALASYRGKQTVNRLLQSIEKDPSIYVRQAALYSVKTMMDKSTILGIFDIYAVEKEPLFRDILRKFIRDHIKRN